MPRAAAGVEAVDTTNARRAGMRCPSTSGVPVWGGGREGWESRCAQFIPGAAAQCTSHARNKSHTR